MFIDPVETFEDERKIGGGDSDPIVRDFDDVFFVFLVGLDGDFESRIGILFQGIFREIE